MLLNLAIKNYALIDDLRLEFSGNMSVFTGETGAGKSIIVESIKLLLGERASSELVKKGAENCLISGEFDVSKLKALNKYLKELALEPEDETFFIRREIDVSGKSRAYVNDVPVNIKTLGNIGDYLVDIHGQHEHQSLFSGTAQRKLLDNFADAEKLLTEISKSYEIWKQLLFQKESKVLSEQEKQRLVEIYSFQVKEIDSASLRVGEDEEIEASLPRLKNAGKLMELSQGAYSILYESEGSILENLGKVQKLIENIDSIGGNIKEVSENLKSVIASLQDSAGQIESYKENLESDPGALEKLLERQDLIRNLKKKYGLTIEEILGFREKTAKELDGLLKLDQNRQELEKEIEKTEKILFSLCEKLSNERKKWGGKLSEGVKKELAFLGMKKARFEISLEKTAEPSAEGWDKVEFMFQPNPGEDLKPLKDIASGGEISRGMLAIKTVFSSADEVPVLIFDEIDTGLGGPMGQVVGKKMSDLSKHHQVICVTHLPQIAAFADQNISVTKETSNTKTKIKARTLSGNDRVEEIARMLSGENISDSARKHAQELISGAQA